MEQNYLDKSLMKKKRETLKIQEKAQLFIILAFETPDALHAKEKIPVFKLS